MTTCGAPSCTRTDTRFYGPGLRCPEHTPAASAGRPEPPVPDPAATLAALRAANGRKGAEPLITSQLNDDRAILSGHRRSNLHEWRDAQMRAKAPPEPAKATAPAEPEPDSLFGTTA